MPKLFISFLGISNYLDCRYEYNSDLGQPVKYVQEDLTKRFCSDWTENDRILFFLTDKAKKVNWLDDGHRGKKTNQIIKNKGLKKRLEELNLKCKIISINIPSGKNEEEFWEIFQIIYEQFNKEDEVIFDVTHSFRSLPIYLIVLLNYAKFLKKIKIEKILYGAYEARKNIKGEEVAPIFDLTQLSYLQEWNTAIYIYRKYSIIEEMGNLIEQKILPILKSTKGKNQESIEFQNFINELKLLMESLYLCRAKEIINSNINNINKELEKIQNSNLIEPFKPCLDLIKNKTKDFKENSIENLITAAKLCYEHNFYQQAVTFLFEGLITIALSKVNDNYLKKNNREAMSSLFSVVSCKKPKSKWDPEKKQKMFKYQALLEEKNIFREFMKLYNSIANIRHDINHCGMGTNAFLVKTASKQKQKIKNLIQKIEQLIQ